MSHDGNYPPELTRRAKFGARDVVHHFKSRVGHWSSQTDKRIERKLHERNKKRGGT